MHAVRYPAPRPADEVIALAGLDGQRHQRVRTLSGGQRRRLDLALGLVGDPELLFLDEPTTGFDPSARRASWDVVRDLCTLGKTVLLTTHYMDEAQALASHVAVITRGRIVASGAPDSIAGRDRLATVVSFVAPPGVAVGDLPGAFVPDGERVRTDIADGAETAPVLHRLTGWALDNDVDLVGLTVTRPTLEDVYLELTGVAQGDGPEPAPSDGGPAA
jgi:ABC-2 type transport system ATP-binding protein